MSVAVGCIGAGNMGGAMVERLCALGWAVGVCDIAVAARQRAVAAGAEACPSPRALAERLAADGALLIVVVDAQQVREVLWGPEGAAAALRPGQLVMLCPTIAPDDVADIGARLSEQGLQVLDAPLSGGPVRARDGSMSLMIAGARAVVQAREPLLQALSARCFFISERCGDAARTKLVNNLLAGINLVGAAEALALAERLGLDAGRTLDVIEQSSGQSWIGSDRMRRQLANDDAPRAHMTLLQKDTRLALEAARAAGAPVWLGPSAAEAFARASADGWSGADDGALLHWFRQQP